MKNAVMLTIRSPHTAPTIEQLKAKYGLTSEEIDASFGVVHLDPNDTLYTILVDGAAAGKVRPDQEWGVEGPYANPKIEPFGPPKS
jgi:hypothetical protein